MAYSETRCDRVFFGSVAEYESSTCMPVQCNGTISSLNGIFAHLARAMRNACYTPRFCMVSETFDTQPPLLQLVRGFDSLHLRSKNRHNAYRIQSSMRLVSSLIVHFCESTSTTSGRWWDNAFCPPPFSHALLFFSICAH